MLSSGTEAEQIDIDEEKTPNQIAFRDDLQDRRKLTSKRTRQ